MGGLLRSTGVPQPPQPSGSGGGSLLERIMGQGQVGQGPMINQAPGLVNPIGPGMGAPIDGGFTNPVGPGMGQGNSGGLMQLLAGLLQGGGQGQNPFAGMGGLGGIVGGLGGGFAGPSGGNPLAGLFGMPRINMGAPPGGGSLFGVGMPQGMNMQDAWAATPGAQMSNIYTQIARKIGGAI